MNPILGVVDRGASCPWRVAVSRWPRPLRRRWAALARALEVRRGLAWHQAERLAVVEIALIHPWIRAELEDSDSSLTLKKGPSRSARPRRAAAPGSIVEAGGADHAPTPSIPRVRKGTTRESF